ncbi:NINE protein [Robiginitomaculum antarcticum]|uniref:NINE protein n=1 Tax=Robiginitomaculum antarcticum TaxID=437507 RepID=UPI00037F5631|nr:NINE protein [Robiginitomaculum antarcticum]
MTTRNSKPWLEHKSNISDPSEYKPKIQSKSISIARLSLILGLGLGWHRFYLDDKKGGWLWILLYSCGSFAAYFISIMTPLIHPYNIAFAGLLLSSFYIAISIYEWRAIPARVEVWNKRHFV